MNFLRMLQSELSYTRKIAAAGWEGIASAQRQHDGEIFQPANWTLAALGAGVGVLSGLVNRKRTSVSTMALGGLIGSFVGLGAGVAWGSRQFAGTAARNSTRLISGVLDARWLERNPIDYA